jgi:hypothetical protein
MLFPPHCMSGYWYYASDAAPRSSAQLNQRPCPPADFRLLQALPSVDAVPS